VGPRRPRTRNPSTPAAVSAQNDRASERRPPGSAPLSRIAAGDPLGGGRGRGPLPFTRRAGAVHPCDKWGKNRDLLPDASRGASGFSDALLYNGDRVRLTTLRA